MDSGHWIDTYSAARLHFLTAVHKPGTERQGSTVAGEAPQTLEVILGNRRPGLDLKRENMWADIHKEIDFVSFRVAIEMQIIPFSPVKAVFECLDDH